MVDQEPRVRYDHLVRLNSYTGREPNLPRVFRSSASLQSVRPILLMRELVIEHKSRRSKAVILWSSVMGVRGLSIVSGYLVDRQREISDDR